MMLVADTFLGMPDALWLALILMFTPVVKYWFIDRPIANKVEIVAINAAAAARAVVEVKNDLQVVSKEHGDMLVTALKGIEEVHAATNGMKDALVKVTGEAEFAKGVRQGEKDAKRETTP